MRKSWRRAFQEERRSSTQALQWQCVRLVPREKDSQWDQNKAKEERRGGGKVRDRQAQT